MKAIHKIFICLALISLGAFSNASFAENTSGSCGAFSYEISPTDSQGYLLPGPVTISLKPECIVSGGITVYMWSSTNGGIQQEIGRTDGTSITVVPPYFGTLVCFSRDTGVSASDCGNQLPRPIPKIEATGEIGPGKTLHLDGTTSIYPSPHDPFVPNLLYKWNIIPTNSNQSFPQEWTTGIDTPVTDIVFPDNFVGTAHVSLTVTSGYPGIIGPYGGNYRISTTYIIQPNFFVLLASDKKQYLFSDCAPFNDPCKSQSNIDTYKGGEFLVHDDVILDGRVSNDVNFNFIPEGTVFTWIVTPPNGLPETLPDTGSQAHLNFPEAGDYSISMQMFLDDQAISAPLIKKVKVESSIEINFDNHYIVNSPSVVLPPNPIPPYPIFNQGQYPKDFHGNGIHKISEVGCGLTSLATIGELRGAFLPGNLPLSPPNLNTYLKDKNGFNANNDVWWKYAVPLLNDILPTTEAAATFPIPIGNKSAGDLPFFPLIDPNDPNSENPDPNVLERLARKRSIAVFWVHTLDHDKNLKISDAPLSKWAKKCAAQGIFDSDQCHETHKHYIVLRGINWNAQTQSRHILIHDPGHDSARDFDATTVGKQGYNGIMYGAMILAPQSLIPKPPTMENFLGDLVITLDGANSYVVQDSQGRQVGSINGTVQPKVLIPNANQIISGIANDSVDSEGESISSEVTSFIPGASYIPGTYSILWSDSNIIKGNATFTDTSGKPTRTIPFIGVGGQLNLDLTSTTSFNGELNISNMRLLSKTYVQTDEEVLKGTFQSETVSDGWNPSNEFVSVQIYNSGDYIQPGSFTTIPNWGWIYRNLSTSNGIIEMRISSAGDFYIKAKNMGDLLFKQKDKVSVQIVIGNDSFASSTEIENSIPKPFVEISTDKVLYTIGEIAKIATVVKKSPTRPDLEVVTELKVNGETVYPSSQDGLQSEYLFPMTFSGEVTIGAQAYLQNKKDAKPLLDGLANLRKEKTKIETQLSDGVDPISKRQLEERLLKINREIDIIRSELLKIRTAVGIGDNYVVFSN